MSTTDKCGTSAELIPKTPSDFQDSVKVMADKLNVGSCKNSSIGGGMGNFLFKAEASASTNSGCEQVAMMANNYAKHTNIVNCILNESSNVKKVGVAGENNMRLSFGGKFSCGGDLLAIQTLSLDLLSQAKFNTTQKTKVENSVKDFLKQSLEGIQKATSETGGIQTGQKSLDVSDAVIDQAIANANVTKIVDESTTRITAKNNMNITFLPGSETIIHGNCIFKQDSAIKMVVKEMFDTAMDSVMSNETIADAAQAIKESQTSDASAFHLKSDSASMIIMVIIVIIILGVGSKMAGGFFKYIIPIIMLIMIVIGIYFYVKKQKIKAYILFGSSGLLLIGQLFLMATGGFSKTGNIVNRGSYSPSTITKNLSKTNNFL